MVQPSPSLERGLPPRVRVVIQPVGQQAKSRCFTVYDVTPQECSDLFRQFLRKKGGKSRPPE